MGIVSHSNHGLDHVGQFEEAMKQPLIDELLGHINKDSDQYTALFLLFMEAKKYAVKDIRDIGGIQ